MDQTQKLIKRGLLEEKRDRLEQLRIKGERLIKDINYNLFPIEDEGLTGIKIEHAAQAMEELRQVVHEARDLTTYIKRGVREL